MEINFYSDEEKKIIEKCIFFLNYIEENKFDCYTDKFIINHKKSKPALLNGITTSLNKTHRVLSSEVLARSKNDLKTTVLETIQNIEIILKEIKMHDTLKTEATHIIDDKTYTISDEELKFFQPLLDGTEDEINGINRVMFNSLFLQGSKIRADGNFSLDDYSKREGKNILKFEERDIIKLTYYELVRLYKKNDVKDFHERATTKLEYDCHINLKGDTLQVSLIELSSENHKLSITEDQIEELKQRNKLQYPLFRHSISTQ